jgi:choline dehydrogenase-like flavoprotein
MTGSAEETQTFDIVIVGGGTAGAVLAARLTEDADRSVCLIEGGPSDLGDDRVLRLRNWINLLGTELDYDYPTTPQPRGNSNIRHSRARVLGGCSSHNTMISFLPLPKDFADWELAGATGWGYEAMVPYYSRLLNRIEPVAEKDRNAIAKDFVVAANSALGVPEIADFNAKPFEHGVGFFSVGYEPETNTRSSSSVAYLHPILDRPNLTLHLETWVEKLLVSDSGAATGVRVRRADGSVSEIEARTRSSCAPDPSTRRVCCCTPGSARPNSCARSASTSSRTCPGSARTCSTTPNRSSSGRRGSLCRPSRPWTPTRACSSAATTPIPAPT